MVPMPLSISPLENSDRMAVEVTLPNGRKRLLITPTTSDYAAIAGAVDTESAMVHVLQAALKDRIVYSMQVGGLSCRSGKMLDFIVSNRADTRNIGVHALMDVEGIDHRFVRQLTDADEHLSRY